MNTPLPRLHLIRSTLLVASALFCANALSADAVTGWRKDTGSAVTSGLDTSSPSSETAPRNPQTRRSSRPPLIPSRCKTSATS
ncbi:MAG: hypothetical protein LBK99_09520 [Opitutaceae bacterium]|nr:hypothetical protein [Opitutaceae bacterium]